MRNGRRIFVISWFICVCIVGTVAFVSAGWVWSEGATIALQIITWGLAGPVWLMVNLLAGFLSAVTGNVGGGIPQLVIASLITFAGVAAFQLALLPVLAKLIRILWSRLQAKA
jgi:hypothetical protein